MGINKQTDIEAQLQIGPTNKGMVRLYISGNGIDVPMDFTPEEALEIAAELTQAAEHAVAKGKSGKS